MPSDDYKAATGGGLKLKGGVSKPTKKKKKAKKEGEAREVADAATAAAPEAEEGDEEAGEQYGDGKTESERQREEMRRKRLDEKMRKEGTKTHKQRVEELNRYLSTLSEHHDMPKIGPG